MDTLSDVLKAVRLKGAVFFLVDAYSPFAAEAPPAQLVAASVMPGSEHVIGFHVITEGTCWGYLIDGEAIRLEAGDVIVFPHGDPHVVASAPGMRADPDLAGHQVVPEIQLRFSYCYNGGGSEKTSVVCGFLGCDARPFNPLLVTLPRVIHVRNDAEVGNGWLSQFIHFAVHESSNKQAGGECILARLSELMFGEVVRRYLASLPPEQPGWLAGLRDRFVGRALALLHERPAQAWTLHDLAREVGLSRSALAERFTHFVGQPPMQYLTQWRMQLAAGLLARGTANMATVAMELGYESEAAFNRSFKKLTGFPPATWRKRQTQQGLAAAG
ncbi:MAG: AraC family transcriptional regulator [Gammaproteobacteria bacterium]